MHGFASYGGVDASQDGGSEIILFIALYVATEYAFYLLIGSPRGGGSWKRNKYK